LTSLHGALLPAGRALARTPERAFKCGTFTADPVLRQRRLLILFEHIDRTLRASVRRHRSSLE
jgi:hypothetical protein